MGVQSQLQTENYFTAVVDLFNELETQQNQQINQHAKSLLDKVFPLEHGSHADVKSYVVYYRHVLAFLTDGTQTGLLHPEQFVALSGHKENPESLLLKNESSHVELVFNPCGHYGRNDLANIDDIQMQMNSTGETATWFSLVKNSGRFCVAKSFTGKDGVDYDL